MYTYAVRDEGSSVYTALSKALKSRPDWRRVKKDNTKANLILLERNNQSYWKLGQQPGIKQLVNYYRGSSVICRKVRLLSLLTEVFTSRGQDPFQWMPESFIIRPVQNLQSHASVNDKKPKALTKVTDERETFVAAHKSHDESCGSGDVWIAKSSSGAKGEGIVISRSPDELIALVDHQMESYVVQKYIERPLLLAGDRKFDIRCWVLLDHEYNIHLMKEGVLRTSSEPYDASDLNNVTSHLTNHCIQEEHSSQFGKYEEGNEMFFDEFNRFLESKYSTTMEDKMLPQIRIIVKECLMMIQEDITTEHLSYQSFQLFGFDFMVDEDFKVWLIEINGAPACAQRLLPQLISSLLELVIDQVFPSQLADDEKINGHENTKFEIIS